MCVQRHHPLKQYPTYARTKPTSRLNTLPWQIATAGPQGALLQARVKLVLKGRRFFRFSNKNKKTRHTRSIFLYFPVTCVGIYIRIELYMDMVLGWVTAPPPPAWAAASSAAPLPSTTHQPCSGAPRPCTIRLPCSSLSYRSCGQNRRHRQLYRLQATASCNTDHVHDDDDDSSSCLQAATSSTFLSSRGLFLQRLASSALAWSSALTLSPGAASSLDAQRDARTARSPPPALLLPVEKLSVSVATYIYI